MRWLRPTCYINKVLISTSLFVLTTFVVNQAIHAVDEWMRCLSARVDTEGKYFERSL